MLVTRTHQGVTWLASDLLTQACIPHAFSTRLGGTSTGPFASLNLGQPSMSPLKDDPATIEANWRRFTSAVGLPPQRASTSQVHGTAAAVWESKGMLHCPDGNADAIISRSNGITLTQRVADCMPLLIATTDGSAVGVIHAGWRGLVGGVIEAGVARLREISTGQPFIAAIGPCISVEAFEVGDEVAQVFAARWPAAVVRRTDWPKPHVDLRLAAVAILRGLGVSDLDVATECTVGLPDLFFSHRRDGVTTGRMAAAISVSGKVGV